MLRKGLAFAALSLGALLALGTTARAQVVNPYELTLSAAGSNSPEFDGFSASANVSIGYYFTDRLEIALRQSLTYSDLTGVGGGSALNASTAVALDYHFQLGDHGEWQPFIGGNIGYVYGDAVNDSFFAAPEGGVKYYVNSNTFVAATVEYQFFFDQGDAGDSFKDGQFIYTLGIGYRF